MPPVVEPLDPRDDAARSLVATRMRATLDEVLGPDRSAAVHTSAEISGRLAWHLEPDREATVLLARDDQGACQGHVLLRVHEDQGGRAGLIATIYVEPGARRAGVATALLEAAETWMRDRDLVRSMTWTDAGNQRLATLLGGRGYAGRPHGHDWMIFERTL